MQTPKRTILRIPPDGYISRQAAADILGLQSGRIVEFWKRAPFSVEPTVAVYLNNHVEVWYHEESIKKLRDFRNQPIPEGFVLVSDAADLIGCDTVSVGQWCRRRKVPIVRIRRGEHQVNAYHRASIETLGRARVAITAREDTENIKALRQMLQHSNDEIESHPMRKRLLQEQAARHLGLSLAAYQILEASGKPLPMDLFVRFQSLRRIPRRCFRSGCNDYKSE